MDDRSTAISAAEVADDRAEIAAAVKSAKAFRDKLEAAGITDVTVSMKEASYSSYNHVGITADGTIQYKWNENGSTTAASGTVRPTLVLTCNTYTKESTGCLFSIPLDEEKAMAALNTVADRITPPETVESASDLTSLPKYPLKAGVDEGTVDYNDGGSQELWTTASWTSGNRAILSVTESNIVCLWGQCQRVCDGGQCRQRCRV